MTTIAGIRMFFVIAVARLVRSTANCEHHFTFNRAAILRYPDSGCHRSTSIMFGIAASVPKDLDGVYCSFAMPINSYYTIRLRQPYLEYRRNGTYLIRMLPVCDWTASAEIIKFSRRPFRRNKTSSRLIDVAFEISCRRRDRRIKVRPPDSRSLLNWLKHFKLFWLIYSCSNWMQYARKHE